MKSITCVFATIAVSVSLSACQTYEDRSWFDPLNLQVEMQPHEPKAVQVTPHEQAFALQFAFGTAEISDAERRAATAFLSRRATAPSDEVFVDFGLLHETTDLVYDRRKLVADLLSNAGLDPAKVRVRSDMQDIGENEVKLTVRTYLVTLPVCPDFTSRSGRTFNNQPHSNWGCATATNLGRMVAEPKDILIGRGDTRADAEALVLSTQRYRAGETKALLIDDTATADSFGAQSSGGGGGGQ